MKIPVEVPGGRSEKKSRWNLRITPEKLFGRTHALTLRGILKETRLRIFGRITIS